MRAKDVQAAWIASDRASVSSSRSISTVMPSGWANTLAISAPWVAPSPNGLPAVT